ASITSGADDFQITDVPLGEAYTVALTTPPANPAECTISNASGTVGNTTVVDISCRIRVDLMGLQTELEDCLNDESAGAEELGPDGNLHLYLDGVEANLDCDNRNINTLSGIGFLAGQVKKLALTNNNLDTNDNDLLELHPLDSLRFLALGGNEGISDNDKIEDLKAALRGARVNLSNTNAATVQLLRLVLNTNGIDPSVLGSVRIRTDFWLGDDNNDDDLIPVYDTFTESITTEFITTRYDGQDNNDEDELSYTVDLAHLKSGVTCSSSAAIINEEVETTFGETQNSFIEATVVCTEDSSRPELTITFDGDVPPGGYSITAYSDTGDMNPGSQDNNDHVVIGEFVHFTNFGDFSGYTDHFSSAVIFGGSSGTKEWTIFNVPEGGYQIDFLSPNADYECLSSIGQGSSASMTGSIASDTDVVITCTYTEY
ncbi:MAG: hypothetical protein ACI9GW_003339, partial [Halieaceae bacterium]